VLIAETGPVAEHLRVREIDDDEGRRLARIVRRGSGPVVTWRRAQTVLLPAQGMDVAAIAKVAFTSEDRVRDVIRNFNADGFGSLYPKHRGGRAPKFTLGQRREIKKIAKSRPAGHGLPSSTWSLAKLADFLVAEGVVDDISHEGLRALLREEGVTFQRLKTWKASKDPRYQAKKARTEHLYAIVGREVTPGPGDPEVIFCLDESGPLNLQPRPGPQWAAISGKGKEPGRAPRRRLRATYKRTAGVRHLFAALRMADTSCTADIAQVKLGADWLDVPEPVATLLRQHLSNRCNTATAASPASPWLFPGQLAAEHRSYRRLVRVLHQHGIPARASRLAAWRELARQAPPAVLADALGVSPGTAMRHAVLGGADWSAYAARRRAPTTNDGTSRVCDTSAADGQPGV